MIPLKLSHKDWFGLTGLLLVWLLLFWPTLLDMENVWRHSDTYMHCYLVPIIALWLISEQPKLSAQPGPIWGLPLVLFVLTALLWLVSYAADIAMGSHLFAVLSLQLLLASWLGKMLTGQLKFPLFYLVFMLPFGEELHPPLQEVTADIAVYLLHAVNIPVFREGLYLSTPVGQFEVAVACSGLRFLIASLAIGCIFAHLYFKTWYRQWLFMLLLVVVSIIANGARAFLLIYVAELSNMKLGFGADHYIYGWLVFILVLLLMFWLGVRFSDKPQLAAAAKTNDNDSELAIGQRTYLAPAVCLLLAAGTVFWFSRSLPLVTPASQPASLTLPAGFQAADLSAWGVHFPSSLAEAKGRNNEQIELYQARFAPRQTQGELVNWANQLFSAKNWTIAQISLIELQGQSAALYSIVNGRGERRYVLSWYQVNDVRTTSKLKIKLAQLRQLFFSPDSYGDFIALSISAGHEQALNRLKANATVLLAGE